jgi:hypothetical protein
MSLIDSQREDEARAWLEATPRENVPTIAGQLCASLKLALDGNREEAKNAVGKHLSECAWNVEYWSSWMAELFALIDETELALDWLENAFKHGFYHYPYLSNHSRIFRKLDDSPRFQELLGRVKIAWEQFDE